MGKSRTRDREIIKRYTSEAAAEDIRYRILRLLMENGEGGAERDERTGEQHRDICKGEQG